jgi:hypothetical protein
MLIARGRLRQGCSKMRIVAAISLSLSVLAVAAVGAERMRFWNTTSVTIAELYLAPAGTTQWGPNQCKNDPDGAVDVDERLTLKDVGAGRYDVKLADKKGRVCIVRNVEVQSGRPFAFAIDDNDLTDCTK